jgi:hypothetical protein
MPSELHSDVFLVSHGCSNVDFATWLNKMMIKKRTRGVHLSIVTTVCTLRSAYGLVDINVLFTSYHSWYLEACRALQGGTESGIFCRHFHVEFLLEHFSSTSRRQIWFSIRTHVRTH